MRMAYEQKNGSRCMYNVYLPGEKGLWNGGRKITAMLAGELLSQIL